MNLKIISAGAGSGKTYRLTQEMVRLLKEGVRPSGIIATTFTRKAAAELQERVRVKLLEEGMPDQADELSNALIGTVHGLGVKLLHRFAFEAGVSPEVAIIADEDQQLMFNQSLATVLTLERVAAVEQLSNRLGLNKREHYDWRREVKNLTDVARANDFSIEVLEQSKQRSFESFQAFLGQVSDQPATYFSERMEQLLTETIAEVTQNEDATKKTLVAVQNLQTMLRELRLRGELYWFQWVKIAKIDPGAKSRDAMAAIKAFAETHDTHPDFHRDIRQFIDQIFDISIAAIREYEAYKNSRGLIDYTDMEVLIKRLLDNEQVKAILAEELDLLMVDEFQDTSPLQLELFLKLSRFANHSIWVGDPKQSIYGFRGAEPRLMQAIIEQSGGVKPEDIQTFSWRSREDIVFATNALFTKAFHETPEDQVALQPKRCKKASKDSVNKVDEPAEMGDALLHWHFEFDEGNRQPGRPWTENCIAESLEKFLAGKAWIQPKGSKEHRPAVPGDVAILCRSNAECQLVAESLHRAGIRAAIARTGLMSTTESKLILACLKYILNYYDSLSVAEILLLGSGLKIEQIIENRLEYLEQIEAGEFPGKWAEGDELIRQLNLLREQVVELSSAEILNLLLEELDLRRTIASWGNAQQRLDNVDVLRKLALQYEEACNRLHTAASLGGFLLWLSDLENNQRDLQGSGEGPNTVNVLTYHKSKGLEWPIVICHSMEGMLRADVWGVEIVPETDTIDLENVLGNRWLRYWVNPYADQYRRTALEERLDSSAAKIEKKKQALQEEARLLYVGITRARDYLIFPSTSRPAKWLNRVWHHGQEDYPTLDPGTDESPWEWKGKFLAIHTTRFLYPRDFTYGELADEPTVFPEERKGKKTYLPQRIDLQKEDLGLKINGRIVNTKTYAPPLQLLDEFDQYRAAKVVKAFLTADRSHFPADERLAMANGLVIRFEADELVVPEALLPLSDAWHRQLQSQLQPTSITRKYPVRYTYQGRLFETIVDVVADIPGGKALIQNSGFAGNGKHLQKKAQELASWLYFSRAALQEVFDTPMVRTYIHFVMSGVLVEVEVKSEK
ncbi:MAG: DNA helicase [Saprospiraceae bacterium]|nr:MAG: DNA helicase [Saprospiraceae bacterium]